jgi:DNA mismatch endonuclease Vsr
LALVDVVTPEKRSEIMSKVRGKDTGPEMKVRRLVHGMGYRYRLHVGKLPGRPDLVFPGRRKIIFVHGCFWHGHRRCKLGRIPKSRVEFWTSKIAGNRSRDSKNIRKISSLGWRSMTVWECQLRDIEKLRAKIETFLG